MKLFFLFLLAVCLVTSCSRESVSPAVTDITLTSQSAKIVKTDNQFGLELFQNINSSLEGQSNVMISPMSVSIALAMVYNGAGGDTKTQIEDMLHKSGMTVDEINQSYKDLVENLANHDPKVELKLADAIFYRDDFSVKPDFITANKNYYSAEVEGLDFSNTDQTLETVNNWVNGNTNGKIDKILNNVSSDDVMYLLNAIYFNGKWEYQFDSGQTGNRSFTMEDNTVAQVPTMVVDGAFNYYSNSTFQMIELPYGSGKFSMLVLLPQSGKNVNDIVPLLSADNLNDWQDHFSKENKKVYLPKFEFRFEKSLVKNLKALGMVDAFTAKANLTGISDGGNLTITEVKHKSYIKVDEQGTEAAAVTVVVVGYTSVNPEHSLFDVNHPFVFLIREKDTNSILFMGKVNDPSKS